MAFWEPLEFGARAVLLKSTVTKSREEIDAISRKHLERLISHAQAHSEFWADKLSGIQDPSFALSDLPTSDKAELMENFDAAITVDDVTCADAEEFFENPKNLGQLFRDKYVLSHTSGSQGQPLIIVQPEDNLELLFALQAGRGNTAPIGLFEVVKHLISPARLAAVTLKPGFYPSASAFAYMPDGAKRFLDARQLSVTDEHMLEHLAEFRPTHLTAYASVLHEIARAIEAGKIDLKPELEQVVNISERLMPQARQHYEEVFGAPVLDDYGMGECMFLTNGCTASHGMHVNADWAMLEVVDKDNQPVPAGKKGAKVLVTNLANYVQPIIRYEVGDIVTMATNPCGCGSNMPLIDRIDGRDSDMFHIETESGTQPLQPIIFEHAVGRILDAREFQIVQEANTKFCVRIEPLPGVSFNRQRGEKLMGEALAEYNLADKLDVEIEVVERLAADGDKKFKRVVSNVKRDDKKK